MTKITNGTLSQLIARGLKKHLQPTATSGLKVGYTLEIAPGEFGTSVLDEPKLRGMCHITAIKAKEGIIEVDTIPEGTKCGDFLVFRH